MADQIPFVHLHVHTEFSLLDGACRVKPLIERASELGQPAVAVTDHGTMFGIYQFVAQAGAFNKKVADTVRAIEAELEEVADDKVRAEIQKRADAARSRRVKPIVGCEAYYASGSRLERSKEMGRYHLVLLAKNAAGYQSLCHLVTKSYEDGFYQKPRVDRELLEANHEGLIITSACLAGEIPRMLQKGDLAAAREAVARFKGWVGEDFYLELMLHPKREYYDPGDVMKRQHEVCGGLIRLALETKTRLVMTNDVHFLREQDAELHDFLLCVSVNRFMDEEDRMRYTHQEFMKSGLEMQHTFGDEAAYQAIAQAYANSLQSDPNPDLPPSLSRELYDELIRQAMACTLEIANNVEEIGLSREPRMPRFEIPAPFASDVEYLRHLVMEGAHKRWGATLPSDHTERIDFELGVIERMGFSSYFLIVWDFIREARARGIMVGPGRGSAAGSAVAYSLRITDVDPIKYNLLFERFLNPDRVSLPDIDVDFEDARRDEVLNYVRAKYGEDHVAGISTFQRMMIRDSISEVAKRYRHSVSDKLALTDPISDVRKYKENTFSKLMEEHPEIKTLYAGMEGAKADILQKAQEVEGYTRGVGRHACGYIIGSEPLINLVPMIKPSAASRKKGSVDDDHMFVQYEGADLEGCGLIKMDFLGLSTLSILQEARRLVEQRFGTRIEYEKIPLDDKKTLDLFARGETIAVFQFESPAMRSYLRALNVDRFEDLVAMNALYRPGPMQFIDTYIRRKKGQEPIEYAIPEAEPILADTYGVTVYQEQLMRMSRVLAGFTPGQSDALRKAMGKKKKDQLAKLEEAYQKGCAALNRDPKVTRRIWAEWQEFAKYAFNRSHSVCYAYLAFHAGYFKAHYPSEWMAANLQVFYDRADKVKVFMEECQRMGIRVLPPDVNESRTEFTVLPSGDIRYGLGAIKSLGTESMKALVAEREEKGPFTDLASLLLRIGSQNGNKKNVEALVQSGALDSITPGSDRSLYYQVVDTPYSNQPKAWYEALLDYARVACEQAGRASLFGAKSIPKAPPTPAIINPIPRMQLLLEEKELVGLYLTEHPLDPFRDDIMLLCTASLVDIDAMVQGGETGTFIVAGLVREVFERENTNRSGNTYTDLNITLDDYSGEYKFRLFGEQAKKHRASIARDQVVCIQLQLAPSRRENAKPEIVFQAVYPIEAAAQHLLSSVSIAIPKGQLNPATIAIIEKEIAVGGNANLLLQIDEGATGQPTTLRANRHRVAVNGRNVASLLAKGFRVAINDRPIEQSGLSSVPREDTLESPTSDVPELVD